MQSEANFLKGRQTFWEKELITGKSDAELCKVTIAQIESRIKEYENFTVVSVEDITKGTHNANKLEQAIEYLKNNPEVETSLGYKRLYGIRILLISTKKAKAEKTIKRMKIDLKS